MTLTGVGTPGTVDHAVDAGDLNWTMEITEPTVTHTTVLPVDHAVDAGDISWTMEITEPTVTHVAAPTETLVLADYNDAGLQVEAAALLVATADATPVPSDLYADSDRGGTGVPIDGEIGLGPDNTVISRIRYADVGGELRLILNDNDNPAAFGIGAYFGAGGDGNDLTMTIQTLTGLVALPASTAIANSGGNFTQWTLTGAAIDLIEAITAGDRFIIAFSRLTSVATNHAVDAGDLNWTMEITEPTVTHTTTQPVDHAVDAGDLNWTMEITEPTVTHTPASAYSTVTVPLTGIFLLGNGNFRWEDNVSIGSMFALDGQSQLLIDVQISLNGMIILSFSGSNDQIHRQTLKRPGASSSRRAMARF